MEDLLLQDRCCCPRAEPADTAAAAGVASCAAAGVTAHRLAAAAAAAASGIELVGECGSTAGVGAAFAPVVAAGSGEAAHRNSATASSDAAMLLMWEGAADAGVAECSADAVDGVLDAASADSSSAAGEPPAHCCCCFHCKVLVPANKKQGWCLLLVTATQKYSYHHLSVQWANCVKCHGPHLHDAANPQHTCCRPCWEPGATFAVCSGCWALHHQLKLINLQAMPKPQRGSSLECEQRDCRQCVYGSPIHTAGWTMNL
mgnify:CR=1 FL=1